MTAKQKLLYYLYKIYGRNTFKTSDVIRLGVNHFSNRADRNARQLREEGFLERAEQWEDKYYPSKEKSYRLTEKGIKEAQKWGQLTLFQ